MSGSSESEVSTTMATGETKAVFSLGAKVTLAACVAAFGASFYGCTHGAVPRSATALLCGKFEPMWWSKHDTKETQEAIIKHNAKWSEFCRKQ